MRLAINTTLFNGDVRPEEAIFKAMDMSRRAGFTCMDLNLATQAREGWPLALDGWERWVDRVGEYAARLGITFRQSHSFYYRTKESTDMTINRPWYEERIRRSIQAAQKLGVKWTVVHPCDFDADEVYDFDKNRRFNREYWQPLIDFAFHHEVGFCFENMFQSGKKRRYCSRVEELIDLVDSFNDPRVGICWDTGHASLAGQKQGESILLVDKRLKCMHIHDNHGVPKQDEHLMPYYGSINWDEVLSAVRQVGYTNDFAFELKHATQPLPPALREEMLAFLYHLGVQMLGDLME